MHKKLVAITQKKQKLDALQPLAKELVKNLDDWYKIELTYSSNAIEGNTLSRIETALVVEKGITVDGKTIVEHLEAVNHAAAINYIKTLASAQTTITENEILNIHKLILTKIDDENAGKYRKVPVRIAGSRVILPNPVKVPQLMAEFITWLNSQTNEHPVITAAEVHYRLVTIHPFIDGNGRTARLLMNLILMAHNYPPAIIKNENRKEYISSLEKAQLGGAKDDFYMLVTQAVVDSLDIFLEAAK